MKRFVKIMLLCLPLVLLHRAATGQSFPVMVQVQVLQPVPPYLPQLKADLSGQHYGQLNQDVTHHLSITLTSTGNSQLPQHLKLAGSIERVAPSPMGVSLRPDFQPQQAIILNRGQMISLNNDLLQQAFGNFSENSLVFNNMDLEALRQNGADFKLPEGTYRVCVTAYDYDRPGFSTPLSAPGTGCAYFTICYTAAAPQLILPVSTMMQNNSEFQVFTPHSPQINFAWTPPATTCGIPLGGLTYNLEIRQVFDGQTVTDALQNPYVFHQQFIPTNSFQLDTFRYAHLLMPGQQYIVRIKTNFTAMPGSPLEIANQGYSQIAAFAFSPVSGGYHTESANLDYDTLPTTPTTISGRLAYRFPHDSSGLTFPVKRETIYLQKVYAKTSVDASGITRYASLTAAEQSSLPPYQDMLDGMTTTTDNNGNFQLNCAMTRLDSAGVIPDSKWSMLFTTAYIGNREAIRPTDAAGYPNADALKGQLACLYRVISTNPAFKPYGQYLAITPGGVHNVSDLVVDADSYTLDVNVQEIFNNVKGNRVAGADVQIFRFTADKKNPHLDIPLSEGDLLDSARDWHESGDKVLIAERITPTPAIPTTDSNAYMVHFPRLFRNPGTAPYNYQICLVKGGVVIGQASYSGMGLTTPMTMTTPKAAPTQPGKNNWTLFFDEADALYGKRSSVQSDDGKYSPVIRQKQAIAVRLNNSNSASAGNNVSAGNGSASPTGVVDAWSEWAYRNPPDTARLTLQKTLIAAPHSQVTGTLQYAYKNDAATPARPYANQPVKLMVYYLFKGQPASGNATMTVSRQAMTVFYQVSAMKYANQDAIVVNPDPGSGTALFSSGRQITDNGSVLQTVNTDAAGRFSFDFENADSTMQTMQGSMDTGLKPGQPTSGTATSGQFTRVYRVVPVNGYFCAPDDNVAVQPWGSFDCGTLTSFVHTYTLSMVITDQTGIPQSNVPVNLCRYKNDNYAKWLPENPAGGAFLNKEVSLTQVNPTIPPSGAGASGSSRFQPVSFTLPTSNSLSLSNQAIVRQAGMTDSRGSIVFSGVTACIDGANDTWIVEADGNATQRTGTITFRTKFKAIPKDFYFVGPNAYFSGVVGENPGNAASQGTGYFSFPGYADPAQVTFNSELQPGKTFYDTMQIVLSPPRYAGRVIDAFSTLGIPGATVSLSHQNYSPYYTTGHVYAGVYGFDAITDPNGYYDDTRYTDFYAATPPENAPDLLWVFAPGYEQLSIKLAAGLSKGQQDYRDPIVLKPLATNAFGYVADAENLSQPVTARVKAKINGRWVDTYSYSGDSDKPSTTNNYLVATGAYQRMLTQGITLNTASSPSVAPNGSVPGKTAPQHQLQMRAQTLSASASQGSPSNAPGVQTFGGIRITKSISGEITAINANPEKGNIGNWASLIPAHRGVSTDLSRHQVSGVQRFDIDLPAIADSIIIMPYDPAYLTQSFAVHPTGPGQKLGVFLLTPRKHRVTVQVDIAGQRPATGAMVSIDGVPDTLVVDQHGQARFEFVNNATKNFMLRIRPNDRLQKEDVPGYAIFGDTTVAFSNQDSGETFISIRVTASRILTGTVRFAGTGKPVSGAVVYPDEGSGAGATTTTGSDGKYRLIGISPMATLLRAAYTSPGSTYTGDAQPLPGAGAPATVNFTIGEMAGIDISRLFGFTARLDKVVKNADNSYSVDGQLIDLPANADFAIRSDIPAPTLAFGKLKVKPSTIKNAGGIPVAIPVQDSISLDAHVLSAEAFAVFHTEITAPGDGLLSVRKAGSDTSGLLSGQARITDNSFNFPSSYLSIAQTDFFLGIYGAPAGAGKLLLPLFTSAPGKMRLNKYSIGTAGGAPIQFKYLGFQGASETTGARESFVMGDSINLFMNLQAKIQNNITLSFSSGSAIIHHDGLGRMITDDSVSFSLENWRVGSGSWELSPASGGIWLKKGTLYTGKVDLPFTDLRIFAGDPAGELTCNSFNPASIQAAASEGLLTVGGGASQLKIYNGTQVIFVYDPDAGVTPGQGHFKLSLASPTGKVAYFGGLDGMSGTGQRFNIQFLSELSDGEELFAFDPKTAPVTFYNQLQFTPQTLFSYPDRIVLGGGVGLGIPGVPDNMAATFTFTHVSAGDGKTNQLAISPLNFKFTGNGGTGFTSSGAPGTQRFSKYGIGISGDLTVPGLASPVHSQLVSMVTSGAADLNSARGNADQAAITPVPLSGTGIGGYTSTLNEIPPPPPAIPGPIKQQAEVLLGDALSEGNAFADQAMDEVTGPVNDARNQLMNQLNQAESSLLQSLPVGAAGQQISNLAGKWRLAGEGLNAIKDFSGNPAGSMLRMNGVIKGFTGIDVDSAAENKLKMIANEQLSGLKDQLPVDQITSAANSSTFAGMHFDFDLKNGCITGSLTMPRLDFGAVLLTDIGIEMRMDRQGWYFYTGAGLDLPQAYPLHPLLFPINVGIIIGDYPVISADLVSRITTNSYFHKLPKSFDQGIHGFFITGLKELLPPTSIDINLELLDFEIGASGGLDARIYANFGDNSQDVGIAGMEFANVFAKLSVADGICGVKGNADLNLGMKTSFSNKPDGVTVKAAACASVSVTGSAWCGPESVDYNKSVIGLLTLCGGADCNKAIDFSISLDGGTCSDSNQFDY